MTEATTAFIGNPSGLKPGTVIVRVQSKGERCYERWQVVRWLPPARPRPGQAQGSGFLRCLSLEDDERREFGPASLLRRDFRIECRTESAEPCPVETGKRFWWQEQD